MIESDSLIKVFLNGFRKEVGQILSVSAVTSMALSVTVRLMRLMAFPQVIDRLRSPASSAR